MKKIWGIRQGMIGDSIMSLPILNHLEILYPRSYKIFAIGKKFSQSAELYINHPLIDRIHVLENDETEGQKDIELINQCDVTININPQHKIPNWYEKNTCIEETFMMAGYELSELKALPDNQQKPRLYKWWKNCHEINNHIVAIFPFAGYGSQSRRSPSIQWWTDLIPKIIKSGYKILHFGSPNEPNLSENNNYTNLTSLPFFDMIKIALTTKISIGTDSGSSWVIGAYGHNQINLLTNEPISSNGLIPSNFLNKSIDLFALNGCDNIDHNLVLGAINDT